jgi:hypothetical protein
MRQSQWLYGSHLTWLLIYPGITPRAALGRVQSLQRILEQVWPFQPSVSLLQQFTRDAKGPLEGHTAQHAFAESPQGEHG